MFTKLSDKSHTKITFNNEEEASNVRVLFARTCRYYIVFIKIKQTRIIKIRTITSLYFAYFYYKHLCGN